MGAEFQNFLFSNFRASGTGLIFGFVVSPFVQELFLVILPTVLIMTTTYPPIISLAKDSINAFFVCVAAFPLESPNSPVPINACLWTVGESWGPRKESHKHEAPCCERAVLLKKAQ